jgi:diamine N-acetyltransferase
MNIEPAIRRIHFARLTAANVVAVCHLSDTLSLAQRRMVTDNAVSIAQGHCSEAAWMRAIYTDQPRDLIGFLMLHLGSDYEDGIDCPGAFLWRLMIAGPRQGQGYGKETLDFLVLHLRSQGYRELYTSCGLGEASPMEFYRRYGFHLTGDAYADQPELVYNFP